MIPDTPRSILANLVNNVMIEAPPSTYLRKMAAVTPRKLWLARPGDCVVLLAPCSMAFREYVESVTGVAADSVDVVSPDEINPIHACELLVRLRATSRVAARRTLVPFVVDAPVVGFARRNGMRIHPFTALPERRTLDTVRLANSKAGFRAIAVDLGLPIADGGFAEDPLDLIAQLDRFLRTREQAIVKVNRSSNGCGTFVVSAGRNVSIPEQVSHALAGQPVRRCGWVFEEFLPFEAAPSIEMSVDEFGVEEFYTCDQRTRENAWTGTGMVTPASGPELPTLLDSATRIGHWLGDRGYRGYFDLDCGVVAGGHVLTEVNVRRTGGTYLEELVLILGGGKPMPWRADARPGSTELDFAHAVRAVRRAGLDDPQAPARVLLTVDTLDVDGLWRYLVAGRTPEAVADAEAELAGILGLT